QLNTLDFIVNVKSIKQDTFYVLVWFDWNRDGCWGGNLVCPDGSVVSEAAVFNQKIVLTSTGKHLFTTKPFYAWIPDEGTPPQPIWMRITLAERPYVFNPENIAHNGIGEGPKEGYLYGETEDYCFTPGAGEGDLDWGDAYDTPDSPAYPTLKVNNGANHHIRGPWLGDNNDYPDADSDGQPGLFALGDDLQNRDDEDGVKMPFLLIGQTVNIPVTVNGGGGIIDAWIEFDKILGWSPEEKVFSGYFPNGDHMIPFLIPPGALQGRTLTRFRISSQGGLAPDGPAEDGEVEDHLAWIEEPPHGMKAPQWPELRPHGIDVRVDATRLIADDWQCAKTDTITDLHLWGSWKNDEKGKITSLWVGFYDNFTPAVASDGGYPENLLWHKEFRTDDFTETLYHTVTEPGEYWWDPFTGNLIKGGDTQVWRLDIEIDPKEAFIQNGKPNAPILYWICIQAKTEGGMFGWKTRWRPEQFNSTAVFATGNPMGSPSWTHLSFPFGHPFAEDRIDMSFILTTRKKEKEAYDFGDAPDPSFPTYLSNNGARHAIDPLLYLGSQIDDEPDGQPDNAASGDDMHGLDDEDGVVFNTPLYLGDTVKLTVTTSDSGVLNAWIDFNNNGSWGDAGEQVFVNQQLGPGQNDLSIVVPGTATTAEVCARFRFSRVRFLNYDGPAPDGEVEDYKVLIEKPGEGATKWSQPPLHNRHSPFPDCYWGWDEPSFFVPINGRRTNQPSFFVESVQDTFRMQFVADDWFCKTVSPITGIRWWGSYRNWRGDRAPENAPPFFRIGIWTDVPALEERPWSHPGVLIWEYTVSRSAAHETLDSCDYIPDIKHLPDSTFRYTVFFPHSNWFIQQPDSSVFWLSITALYDRPPDSLVWGWKTRDHYFQDDAVRVFVPSEPSLDESFQEGEPVAEMWDMAFELFTDLYEMEFDFGDAPDPGYATLRKSNGAQHYIVPGISLGQRIDAEPDGQPDAEARGDNRSGSNDEDGVTFVSDLVAGRIAGIEVQFPATGILNAWIDFNGDSLWDAPEEHVIADVKMAAGRHALEFHVPGNAVTGSTFARFRFSTVSPRSPKGIAIDGEVEDYLIKILPTSVERKQEKEHLPAQFMLWQNYPNPFNPSTEIRYDLPRDVSVRISIYNLIGHELCVLVYKPHRAGYYTVTWNGKDDRGRQVPSGIYIYRLTAGEFTAMRKLVFVK
ncbi:T9SS type A sorting domain-containing protein, partial [candidate division KSB1 bacterium]|nr:T9SS type A sorting domain-containing protein [candidate division KSB1 bacterium]